MPKHKGKRGDTLVEVMLAVGIFSMVAIAVVAVMSAGSSSAQTSLETTLAREEIDAQAEALRFIHSAYISEKNSKEGKFTQLWNLITAKNPDDNRSVNVVSGNESISNIAKYSPSECPSLYSEDNGEAREYGFILNTKALSSFVNLDDVLIKGNRKDSARYMLNTASTYPRLVYGNSVIDAPSLIDNYSNFYQASGIYIVAVKDPNSTNIIGEDQRISAYYDFYIRTCWYGTSDQNPSAISTVIRLYDPDALKEIETPETPSESTIAFKIGDRVKTLIVADSSEGYKPYYITSGSPKIFENVPAGRKYIVTVVLPVGFAQSFSWDRDSRAGTFKNPTLFTSTYIAGEGDETLTVNGIYGGGASYPSMQNLANSQCTSDGVNVEDSRDGNIYTVARIGSKCYMLSNLRLSNKNRSGGQRILFPTDSDVNDIFQMPDSNWTSSSQNYFCKAMMAVGSNGEYYYNWYAAEANSYDATIIGENPTNSNCAKNRDDETAASICPAGWTLPDYNAGDNVQNALWGNGTNSGMLTKTGTFSSGSQGMNFGRWWFKNKNSASSALNFAFSGASVTSGNMPKTQGLSIRCVKK